MNHTPRIQSVISAARRPGDRPLTTGARQRARVASEAVVAGYIQELTGSQRRRGSLRRPGTSRA